MYGYEFIGFTALILLLWIYIPRGYRKLRHQCNANISPSQQLLLAIGFGLGALYGIGNSALSLVIGCVIGLVFNLSYLAQYYKDKKNPTP